MLKQSTDSEVKAKLNHPALSYFICIGNYFKYLKLIFKSFPPKSQKAIWILLTHLWLLAEKRFRFENHATYCGI